MLAGLFLSIACAGQPSARDTLSAFASASNPETVRKIVKPSQRVASSTFNRQWKNNLKEISSQQAAVSQSLRRSDTQLVAQVHSQGGRLYDLIFEDGQWKIRNGIFDLNEAQDPLSVLQTMRHALQQQNLPLFLSLLSRRKKADLLDEISELILQTSDPLNLKVTQKPDKIEIRTPEGYVFTVVREGTGYRLDDIDVELPQTESKSDEADIETNDAATH